MKQFYIRPARPADRDPLAQLRHGLWPGSPAEDHANELALILAGEAAGILPAIIFVAESNDAALLGFLEAGLRSHADGCDPSHPKAGTSSNLNAATASALPSFALPKTGPARKAVPK